MKHNCEIFPRSLVKQVIFQIRFPNLFYLKDRIGEFQTKIMKDFPESEQIFRRQFFLSIKPDINSLDQSIKKLDEEVAFPDEATIPIWKFQSEHGVNLEISSDNMTLYSFSHKSYFGGSKPFRDIIDTTSKMFISITQLPVIKRIGLRYINEGPLPENPEVKFTDYYNTSFPQNRFSVADTLEMNFMTVIKKNNHHLRYIESLQKEQSAGKMILDYDLWSENIDPTKILPVTDELHDSLWEEFRATIKEPVLEYMRKIPEILQ